MEKIRFICPICKEPLLLDNKEASCNNNHHFDRAKSGYLNLLPNYKSSGDNELMINARRAFLSKGYFQPLLAKVITIIKAYDINSILDVGSGEGYYSREIAKQLNIPTCGIDISKYACMKSSKLSKDALYIVASIFDMPFADKSFDCLINVFAPHSPELERVSKKLIIKVIPNLHHLWELKTILYEDPYLKESNEGSFSTFIKAHEEYLTYQVEVEQIEDLVKMTPYYYKSKISDEIFKIQNLVITMDFKIIIYESRG